MDHEALTNAFTWFNRPEIRVVAIVGICKNAGKTSMLNHLLAVHGSEKFGVFSTGIDGEDTDTVFRTPKPKVVLGADQIFCCDTATLDMHKSALTVLEKLAFSNVNRPLWLARTNVPIQTEITGPPTVQDQIKTVQRMQSGGVSKVLVDGSLDRKSIALSDAVDAVVVMIGASFGSVSTIVTEIKRLELLNHLPSWDVSMADSADYALLRDSEELMLLQQDKWQATGINSLIGAEEELRALKAADSTAIYIPGAITDSVYTKIKAHLIRLGSEIILRHPDCLKLSYPHLEQFIKDFRPSVLIPFKIRTFSLNTLAIGSQTKDAGEMRKRLRNEFPHLPLPDIRELEP